MEVLFACNAVLLFFLMLNIVNKFWFSILGSSAEIFLTEETIEFAVDDGRYVVVEFRLIIVDDVLISGNDNSINVPFSKLLINFFVVKKYKSGLVFNIEDLVVVGILGNSVALIGVVVSVVGNLVVIIGVVIALIIANSPLGNLVDLIDVVMNSVIAIGVLGSLVVISVEGVVVSSMRFRLHNSEDSSLLS